MESGATVDRAALAALGVDDDVIAQRQRLDGERALAFLAALPARVRRCQQELGLREARMLPGGVLSAVLACRQGDDRVVLKLSAADARAEAAALAAWGGARACRLRWASADGRAMLLSAIEPGIAVTPGDEFDDRRRAADLMSALHRQSSIPDDIPDATIELAWRFARAHRQLDGPSPARDLISHAHLDEAHARALTLHTERSQTVLCHGDFMAKNLLLDATGEWWAIDPRPCAGDPCLDAAFWAIHHRPGIGVTERCEQIAQLAGLRPDGVSAWARVFAATEAALAIDRALAEAHSGWLGASTSDDIR